MRTFQSAPPCPTNHFGASQSFDAMICAYKTCGGTARADDLALLLEERQKGDFVSVAKAIVSRDIFSFDWGNHFWVPMFQFNRRDMSVKKNVRRVVQELTAVLDNWALAQWFTEPNAWLYDQRPVDLVDEHFSEVFDAARAERFVVTG